MKTVIVICVNRAVGDTFVAQLKRFFQETVPIACYCLHDTFAFDSADVLAILTGQRARAHAKVQERIAGGMEWVVARRAIDYTRIQELLKLPEGSEVLLVNDYEASTRNMLDHLRRIGLNHLNYHPYYPGLETYPRLKLAVTPGEAALAPACVERIVDIGCRPADISTIVEVVQRLGMMEQLGDSVSSQHLQEITRLLREINEASRHASQMRDTLQVIAEHAPNGILYTDLSGRVILGNHAMSSILRMDPDAMVNRSITELVPDFPSAADRREPSTVLSLRGQDLIMREKPVRQGDSVIGHIYAFEKGQTIQTLEYELRRKSRLSEHEARYTFGDILSESESMGRVLVFAKRVAQSDSTVLIHGESGTGKELIAQAIHNASRRRQGPFVPVNFASFPASLLESELFGYEDGAFTGARKGGRRGLFAEAHGGTLFLDEIGDAPLDFQVRLLRVLQERQVRPVGGHKLIPIDVRIIAATHRDLVAEIREGRFREDLYYRLSVLPLQMPSLRERQGDVRLLLDHFIRQSSRGQEPGASSLLSPEALARLCSYPWPGNIRQLMNAVEYLLNVREGRHRLAVSDLPEIFRHASQPVMTPPIAGGTGRDLAWVLTSLHAFGRLGRRRLANLARVQRPHLTETVIRGLLKQAEERGLIVPGQGRQGNDLTAKGLSVLTNVQAGDCGSLDPVVG